MELRHLKYFLTVAQKDHVSEAADELHVAQASLAKQLGDLEHELGGNRLFERVYGRKIRLTVAGELLRDHAQEVLDRVEQLRAEMRALRGFGGGRVIIGSPQSVGEKLLPSILAAFHNHYPEVEIVMVEGNTRKLVEMLDRKSIDLAIVSLPLKRDDLLIKSLFKEKLVLVVGENHRLAARVSLRFRELRDEKFLLYAPGGFIREATLKACQEANFRPGVALDGGSMEMLLRLAEAGLGVSVLPPLALQGERHLRGVKLITEEVSLEREMGLVTRQREAPTTSQLRTFLEASLGQRGESEPAD
jgi:DNA-binding transcriptional LysR family regulator